MRNTLYLSIKCRCSCWSGRRRRAARRRAAASVDLPSPLCRPPPPARPPHLPSFYDHCLYFIIGCLNDCESRWLSAWVARRRRCAPYDLSRRRACDTDNPDRFSLRYYFFLFVSSLILFWSCVEFCIFTYRNCICSGRSIRSGNVYVFFLYSTSVGRDVMSPSGVRSGH